MLLSSRRPLWPAPELIGVRFAPVRGCPRRTNLGPLISASPWPFLNDSSMRSVLAQANGGVVSRGERRRVRPSGVARPCGSRKPRRPAGSTQKGPLSASPIERVTILFTVWKERRTFGDDKSPTLWSHEYEQVCRNGIFVTDTGQKCESLIRPASGELHRSHKRDARPFLISSPRLFLPR
jgi:hypothetical protein